MGFPTGKMGLQPVDVWEEKYVGSQTITIYKVMYFHEALFVFPFSNMILDGMKRKDRPEARKAVLGKSAVHMQ